MNPINELSELFLKFPGIGERQAKRFVFFLIRQDKYFLKKLSEKIENIKNITKQCEMCFKYFTGQQNVCEICSIPTRDNKILMIVEKDSDIDSIEKSRVYNGLYFVLGSLIPVVEKRSIQNARIVELTERIKKEIPNEIILAFANNPNGDHTDEYVREKIKSDFGQNLIIKTLGRGISTGSEIEYSDTKTLEYAMKNRQ